MSAIPTQKFNFGSLRLEDIDLSDGAPVISLVAWKHNDRAVAARIALS